MPSQKSHGGEAMKKSLTVAAIGLLALAGILGGATIASAAPPQPGFYVDGAVYRTVGTQTDFSNTGAPDHSYDTIYAIEQQMNVAEAAPGDTDYNGGRWMVRAVVFTDDDYAAALTDDNVDMNGNDVLDSAEEVEAALALGYATDGGVVKMFECPVIPMPKGKS
jgi:hypothetical protein